MDATKTEAEGLRDRLRDFCLRTEMKGKETIARRMGPELRTDPWTALNNLQNDLSLQMPTALATLRLLGSLNVPQLDAHVTLCEVLKDKLEAVVGRLAPEHLLILLKETMPLFQFKELKGVPLAIAKRLPTVPAPALKVLMERNLIEEMPLSIRRQAWEVAPASFAMVLKSSGLDNARAICDMVGRSDALFKVYAELCVSQHQGTALVRVAKALHDSACTMRSYETLHELAVLIEQCVEKESVEQEDVKAFHQILEPLASAHAAEVPAAAAASAGPTKVPKETLLLAWNTIAREDPQRIFLNPVTDAIAPNYSKVVSRPMALATIKTKINTNKYVSLEAFEDDVELMVSNCRQYNGEASELALLGGKLLSKLRELRPSLLAARVAEVPPVAARPAQAKPSPAAPKPAPPTTTPAAAPVPVAPAVGPTDPELLMKTLVDCWKFVKAKDVGSVFLDPVEKIIPTYRSIISHPMDLETMKEKVKNIKKGEGQHYKSIDEFDKDLKLMFANCRKFNGPGTEFAVLGERIYADWVVYKRQAVAALAKAPPPATAAATALAAPVPPAGFLQGAGAYMDAWRFVSDLDVESVFKAPVSLPGYEAFIAHPMDLSKIKSKIARGAYSRPEDLDADMQLMFSNCQRFNKDAEDRLFFTYASALKDHWKDLIAAWTAPGSGPERFKQFLSSSERAELKVALDSAPLASVDLGTAGARLLTALDGDRVFGKVPTNAIAPNYSSVVKSPVAIETIRLRKYGGLDALHKDVVLMCHNCLVYNTVVQALGKYCLRYLAKWLVCAQLLQRRAQETAVPAATAPTAPATTLKIPKRKREESEQVAALSPKKARPSSPPLPDAHSAEERRALEAFRAAHRGVFTDAPGDFIVLPGLPSAAELRGGDGSLATVLRACWDFLAELDADEHFKQPITNAAHLAVLERTTDLSTMRVRIDLGRYADLAKFSDDVVLMAHNFLVFHAPLSIASKAAQRVAYGWRLLWQNAQVALGLDGAVEEASLPATNRSAPPPQPQPQLQVDPEEGEEIAPEAAQGEEPPLAVEADAGPPAAPRRDEPQPLTALLLLPAGSALLFGVLMLRDARLQRLLAAAFVRAACASGAQALTTEAACLFQLCQVGCTRTVHVPSPHDHVFGSLLPHLLRHRAAGLAGARQAHPLPERHMYEPDALQTFLETVAQGLQAADGSGDGGGNADAGRL